jgi:ferredoxin
MANLADRLPQNVPGRFYVDAQCIDCDLCRETAPNVFTRHDESGFSYVYRQPLTPEDLALAEEALQGCPVEAIGHDGAESAEAAQESTSTTARENSQP